MSETTGVADGPRIVLYSDDVDVREEIRLGVGPRLAGGASAIDWVEVATGEAARAAAVAGDVDLMILDGEADKIGGLGLARQLKDEVFDCPPVVVLIARPADAWLAAWSNAEAVVSRPIDPMVVHDVVAGVLGRPAAHR